MTTDDKTNKIAVLRGIVIGMCRGAGEADAAARFFDQLVGNSIIAYKHIEHKRTLVPYAAAVFYQFVKRTGRWTTDPISMDDLALKFPFSTSNGYTYAGEIGRRIDEFDVSYESAIDRVVADVAAAARNAGIDIGAPQRRSMMHDAIPHVGTDDHGFDDPNPTYSNGGADTITTERSPFVLDDVYVSYVRGTCGDAKYVIEKTHGAACRGKHVLFLGVADIDGDCRYPVSFTGTLLAVVRPTDAFVADIKRGVGNYLCAWRLYEVDGGYRVYHEQYGNLTGYNKACVLCTTDVWHDMPHLVMRHPIPALLYFGTDVATRDCDCGSDPDGRRDE